MTVCAGYDSVALVMAHRPFTDTYTGTSRPAPGGVTASTAESDVQTSVGPSVLPTWFRVEGLRWRIRGLRFRVEGLGFVVEG